MFDSPIDYSSFGVIICLNAGVHKTKPMRIVLFLREYDFICLDRNSIPNRSAKCSLGEFTVFQTLLPSVLLCIHIFES